MMFERENKILAALLRVKEIDMRSDLFTQCQTSADGGIHIGGAQSAIAPLVALFHGGVMQVDVKNPTSDTQDVFLLSKGHAIAALAAVYADVGYFSKQKISN